jgi:addiction module RelE/StbE family toxin
MRSLVLTPSFRRTYRKLIKRNPQLQKRLEATIAQVEMDVFHPSLGTHKLSGSLAGYWACSCGYDCRIVFAIESAIDSDEEVIILLDIGKHDEVY